jgi:lysozyme family protein
MFLADPPRLAIDALIDALIDREGGYVNHPADRGGPTRWGITEAVARAQGYTGPMRDLPRAEAATIYRRIYWLRPAFDRVAARAPRIAAELFDTGVNMGTAIATGVLQRALNALNRTARDYPDIMVDRALGPRTLSALDGSSESARQGRRNRAAARDGGAAGRTLHRARRTPPEPGGLSLGLARKPHRRRLTGIIKPGRTVNFDNLQQKDLQI